MTTEPERMRKLRGILSAAMVCAVLCAPAGARSVAAKKRIAHSAFEQAERLREALNGRPAAERSRRDYTHALDAYRKVYYTAPTSSKADSAVLAVAELLAEEGRDFDDSKLLEAAIKQYGFLRREYPGSKNRFGALYAVGEIYRDDLDDAPQARATFEEFLRRYPHHELAEDAHDALTQMDAEAAKTRKSAQQGRKSASTQTAKDAKADVAEGHAGPSKTTAVERPSTSTVETGHAPSPREGDQATPATKHASDELPAPVRAVAERAAAAAAHAGEPESAPAGTRPHTGLPRLTGIRHWSTPEYTRVAIDLEQAVKFESGRVSNPDRIFFDLADTKLAPGLMGKEYEVEDGLLKKIRVAQFQREQARVVLDVGELTDFNAFLLPNPYRLIIDIHGKKAAPSQSAKDAKDAPTQTAKDAKNAKETGVTPGTAKDAKSTAAPLQTQTAKDAKADLVAERAARPHARVDAGDSPAKGPAESAGSTNSAPKTRASGNPVEGDRAVAANASAQNSDLADPTSDAKPRGPAADPQLVPASKRGKPLHDTIHVAQPTAAGDRSLVRALGLKIGRIVVDAGHGGHDTGTIGPSGLLEKDLVLDVALRLGKLLEVRMGADVVYTRDDDTFVPLETRTAVANREQADLFISVHANSSRDPAARGIETYYLNFTSSPDALEVAARENAVSDQSIHELQDLVKKIALKDKIDESREFAGDVQQSLKQGLSGRAGSTRDRGVKKAPFIVLIGANMPSILAEISFLSNPADERRLKTPEYRQKIADSLYHGVAKYVGGLSGVKVATAAAKSAGE